MRCVVWLGALLAAAGVLASKPACAQQAPPGEALAEARERAALLAQTLPLAVRERSLPIVPPIVMISGALMGTVGVAARSPAWITGGVLELGGGIGFYLAPEERNYELLRATALAGTGLFYLGFQLPDPDRRWELPISMGYLATSALGLVNFAYSTNPGRTRLRRDLDRVRTPAARSSLSVDELRQIENDMYGTDPFVPQWAMGLPLLVSGAIAGTPLFDRDVPRVSRDVAAIFSVCTMVQGLAISLMSTPADQYRNSLQSAGLWVKWGVGPGGVVVTGSFD